jgi:hypothetical protein
VLSVVSVSTPGNRIHKDGWDRECGQRAGSCRVCESTVGV